MGWTEKILCVFCGKPWTDAMVKLFGYTKSGCETCGWGSGFVGTVEIHCEHCQRLIYSKEFDTSE